MIDQWIFFKPKKICTVMNRGIPTTGAGYVSIGRIRSGLLPLFLDSGTVPHRQIVSEFIIMYEDTEGGRASQEHVILVRMLVAYYVLGPRARFGNPGTLMPGEVGRVYAPRRGVNPRAKRHRVSRRLWPGWACDDRALRAPRSLSKRGSSWPLW